MLKYTKLVYNKKKNSLNGQYLITKMKNNKKYIINLIDYISLAKILAVFSVVILHTNGSFWLFNYDDYKKYWISSNIIESIFYFGVPFFLLCIGSTLLDFNERYGLKEYYKKRFKKVILPLISWNIILYFYGVYILKDIKKEKLNFAYLWNLYYEHKINPIFESFHSFVIIYMIIPLLAYIKKTQKIKIYSYCLFVLFINQILIPYLINLFQPQLIWIYNINSSYIIYIFAGYIIHNYKFSKIFKSLIYFSGIIGLLIHMFGTQYLTLKHKKIIKLHKGYLNLPCFLYSFSLFLFIKEFSILIFKYVNKQNINKVGSLTIGPFFLHMPLIKAYHKLFYVNIFSLTYRLFGGIFICIICLFITSVMKKVPLIKYLVP